MIFFNKSLSLITLSTLYFLPLTISALNTSSDPDTGSVYEAINETRSTDNITSPFLNTELYNNQPIDTIDDENEQETTDNDELAIDIVKYAAKHLGTPYRYGAIGPKRFDCSGFIGHVYNKFNIKLNRSSRDQYRQGEKINVKDIKPGDLMFFAGRKGGSTVGHVGMAVEVLPDGRVKFIHAATHNGVMYNVYPSDSYYGKRFIGARRVLTDGHQG
ncbi:MAG: C40 family peptidase [Muribaculaceae bacterium]|nr:C40 family peptidase [Muribaculaceae bacterium]